jgi:hypothetical protein
VNGDCAGSSANTALGNAAGIHNTTGGTNVFMGFRAGFRNTEGNANTFVGSFPNANFALVSTGTFNTAVGSDSCLDVGNEGQPNVDDNWRTCIGAGVNQYGDAGMGLGVFSNPPVPPNVPLIPAQGNHQGAPGARHRLPEIFIGGPAHDVWMSVSIIVGANNQGFVNAQQPNNGLVVQDNWFYSDKRIKNIKGANNDGLDKVKKLKVFNYTMKGDKHKAPRVGVTAQDLQEVFPNAVVDRGGALWIDKDYIFYSITNALKELNNKINSVLNPIKILEDDNKKLEARNKALEARLLKLEAKLK